MSSAVRWQQNADLRPCNSFRVDARAERLCRGEQLSELRLALRETLDEPGRLLLGGGSNLLFVTNPEASVIQPALKGIEFSAENETTVEVTAAAGESWDALVRNCCEHALWGIENLALIPGSVGAAPVQNIGAYGVELSDSLSWVEAMALKDGSTHRLSCAELELGYRDSVFKREPEQWLITAIGLKLLRSGRPQLAYSGLSERLRGVVNPSPMQVADAVSALRREKLPDPSIEANAGSFFKNPQVPRDAVERLLLRWPALPCYEAPGVDQLKLSAAWLIERLGWKGHRRGDAGISARHALVLVNHGDASGRQLLELARDVAQSVLDEFGIHLMPEPKIIGADFWGAS